MASPGHRVERAEAVVLLLMHDLFKGRSYVEALEKAAIRVEWVTTTAALRSRVGRADLPRPALIILLPSPSTTMAPSELVAFALRLTTNDGEQNLPTTPPSALEQPLADYCVARALSPRQRQVLKLYLAGHNDKEIASSFSCSATTVYEHWRRMAKKANGAHKSDVVNDFHRFLATRSEAVTAPALGAARRSRPPSGA